MQYLSYVFGKRLTPQERLRKHQRALERTQRELDRERIKLETQEKQLINDIRKQVKEGHTASAKLMAKDLIRTKNYIQKFYQMKTQLQAVSLRIQTVRSNQQMATSMQQAGSLLSRMNRSMNLPALSKIAMEFERETDLMDQKQEMMDDAMEDGLEDDEEESDEIVDRVLDEIGIDLNRVEAPKGVREELEVRMEGLRE